MGKIRGTHSSPGVYTKITDLQYAAKSLGITTLGLVGETKKGPAFEPVAISDWAMFQDYFGGTSTEKFADSQMPKYELPYIAKSYLSASDQLYVCRVLGLSGYNAGPAFAIYATNDDGEKYLVAVLRSRGAYNKYGAKNRCNEEVSSYDVLEYFCEDVKLEKYTDVDYKLNCGELTDTAITNNEVILTPGDYGKFTLVATKNNGGVETYVVSFNLGDQDYVYNVLGSEANNGTSVIYVEALYDMELRRLVDEGIVDKLGVEVIKDKSYSPICDPVKSFLTIKEEDLSRKHLGQTFLFSDTEVNENAITEGAFSALTNGVVYKVTTGLSGTQRVYKYEEFANLNEQHNTDDIVYCVNVLDMDAFYTLDNGLVVACNNVGDYREQFRHAMTPWFVSELKGDKSNIEVKKLFRFHTITDGAFANEQIKVTIANVRPDDGTFDVLIRDFNDSDGNQVVLESYKGVNMIPGSSKYIGLKIGTLNGDYELKSKYVMVEVIENEMTETCVPCGFLGYPVRSDFGDIKMPSFSYNTVYDEDIKANKQCFGMSDITGVDIDMLYYKGKDAYTEHYASGYTNAFHLDSNISIIKELPGSGATVTVDGEVVSGWDTVSINSTTMEGIAPVIASEQLMEGTIYEDVKLRKFTCYPYGGFDGWDVYRGARTNSDEFRANKYRGAIENSYGKTFSKIQNGDSLALDGNAITSDYYAYLAGYNQFSNPEKYVINLFATPGIDYVNQKMLSEDVLDMIHERQDTFYVMTTPDKPYGAGESTDEMYSASDVVANLEDSAIDTYYASTYYPWVRYYDAANAMYISLPVTKDVLRNMANVDNKSYPWFAPAGIERGDVDCVRARIFTKLSDEDEVYDGKINPVKTFSADGVKVWGNKTLYSNDTPMNRINAVRLVLYMRKLIIEASRSLIFDPNDATLKAQFEGIIKPILSQIKSDRGITDFKLQVSQTPEQIDAHELSAAIFIKPTPSLEYIELNFIVTPQGVEWDE